MKRPRGILLDYGGTLVEEAGFDARAGCAALLARASHLPPAATLDAVTDRTKRVAKATSVRREETGIETPWPALHRLIHEYFGTRFDVPEAELEREFWDASVTTLEIPGARAGLDRLAAAGVTLAVVSNAMFSAATIRHDLAKHGLADHLCFVMVTADYVVRKPSALLFDVAAARLGMAPDDVWFVGDRLDTDVAGANAAGMVSVWLQPPNAVPSSAPDITVANWAELGQRFEETT